MTSSSSAAVGLEAPCLVGEEAQVVSHTPDEPDFVGDLRHTAAIKYLEHVLTLHGTGIAGAMPMPFLS